MTALTILLLIVIALLAAIIAVAGYFAFVTRRVSSRAERLVPPEGRFVTIDGNRIHYVDKGEGRPILFIHGLGAILQHFRHPLFDRFGDGYRLIALDRAGSGYSTRVKGSTGRLPEQADLIAKFIDAVGLDRPLLVGHSLGGAVALRVALDHPEKISGLALIAPLTHHVAEPPPEFRNLKIRSAVLRRLLSATVAVPMSVRRSPQTLAFVFGPQQAPADYAIEGAALSMLRPSHFYATATDYAALDQDMPRQETRYGEITLPTAILFGAEDRVLDYRMHGLQMEGKLAGLDLEVVEGVGHMPQYAVTDRVIAFIRRAADRAFAG